MKLEWCPSCGREYENAIDVGISKFAFLNETSTTCPHCGHDNRIISNFIKRLNINEDDFMHFRNLITHLLENYDFNHPPSIEHLEDAAATINPQFAGIFKTPLTISDIFQLLTLILTALGTYNQYTSKSEPTNNTTIINNTYITNNPPQNVSDKKVTDDKSKDVKDVKETKPHTRRNKPKP